MLFHVSAQGEKFYNACLKLATDNGRPYDMAAVYIALGNMHTNSKVCTMSALASQRKCLNIG